MKVAFATRHGRLAPCFAGVSLTIADDAADREWLSVPTAGWHPLSWGRELMKRDVAVLVCAGIDHATWGAVQGHGIDVVPDATGELDEVVRAWQGGQLEPPSVWPSAFADEPAGPRTATGRGRRNRWRHGGHT